jgi:thiol-disulfide isomerase/thioredoxin
MSIGNAGARQIQGGIMSIFQAALVACALGASPASGETVLLDFTATWCGPCRQMEPVVRRLTGEGHPVRKIDIDADPDTAKRFKITGVPSFIMIRDGRETGRIVGATSYEELVRLLGTPAAAGSAPTLPASFTVPSNALPTGSAQNASMPNVPTSAGEINRELVDRVMASSVRIEIYDAGGQSVGSGTVIDARQGEALVLTCGHIFRDSDGKGRITVDLFGPGAPQDVPARVVGYDLESDIGFISFRSAAPLTAARVAPAGYRARSGQPVVSVGCDHGADASPRVSRVTTIDKFLGTPNLQVAGQPVQGRSGGGLFSAEGYVIGVCNAADPEDDEGLFAALPAIHAEINQLGLGQFVLPHAPIVSNPPPAMPAAMPAFGNADASATIPTSSSVAGNMDARPAAGSTASFQFDAMPILGQNALEPTLPTGPTPSVAGSTSWPAMPAPPKFSTASLPGAGPASPAAGSTKLSAPEQTLLGDVSAGAEVVCIVRPLADARAKSRVVVLDRASPEFLAQLADAQRRQDSRTATSYTKVAQPLFRIPDFSKPAETPIATAELENFSWTPYKR